MQFSTFHNPQSADPNDDDRLIDEPLELVERAWTEAPYEYEWDGYNGRTPMVRPRPYQRPMPEIVHASTSADSPSMRLAAKHGRRLLFGRLTIDRIQGEIRKFNAA